jgi:hypothetical protein
MFIFYFLIRFSSLFFLLLFSHQMDMKTIGSIYYENYVSTLITNVFDIKITMKESNKIFYYFIWPFSIVSIHPQQIISNFSSLLFYYIWFHWHRLILEWCRTKEPQEINQAFHYINIIRLEIISKSCICSNHSYPSHVSIPLMCELCAWYQFFAQNCH